MKKDSLCYSCKFVCYDFGLNNGYCNNKLCKHYRNIIVDDYLGCTVFCCPNYKNDKENTKEDVNVSSKLSH